MKIRRSWPERIGGTLNLLALTVISLVTLYPFWHVLMYSLSNSKAAMSGGIFLYPRQFTLTSYQMLFQTSAIFVAYRNTLLKTVVGTLISLILSALTAFPLSVPRLRGRNVIAMFIFATMLFSGGMIPTFLLVRSLGLIDTFWALVLPGAMSAYNMFILRNFFQGLPPALEESAYIDGASPPTVLVRIILPLSMPALAALTMFYGMGNWNSYMDNILYINTPKWQVLQVYLRNLLDVKGALDAIAGLATDKSELTQETVKMTAITVSILPILIVYPFLQRYYTKGIVVGAVKG